MQGTERYCELPGCGALIEDVPGRPARRYCGPEHRGAARRVRRAATAADQAGRLSTALPWVDGAAATAAVAPLPAAGQPPVRPAPIAAPAPLATVPVVARPAVVQVSTAVPAGVPVAEPAQIADVEVEHALEMAPAEPETAPAPTESWTASGVREAAQVVVARPGGPNRSESGSRVRSLAVLGAAAVLMGSYAVTSADQPAPAGTVPVEVTPMGETPTQWAARAQRVLDATTAQLDQIADTEVVWGRATQAQRAAARSAPIEALQDRKQLLMARQATLKAQLENYHALLAAQERLAAVEHRLAEIEAALADVPPVGSRTPEQAHAIAVLLTERDVQVAERAALRTEVRRLERAVTAAARAPLPADDRHTALVSDLVLDSLAETAGPGPASDGTAARGSAVLDDRRGAMVARASYEVPAAPQEAPSGGLGPTVRKVVPKPPLPLPQPQPPGVLRRQAPVPPSAPEAPKSYFGGGGMGGMIAGPLMENIPGAMERFGGGGSTVPQPQPQPQPDPDDARPAPAPMPRDDGAVRPQLPDEPNEPDHEQVRVMPVLPDMDDLPDRWEGSVRDATSDHSEARAGHDDTDDRRAGSSWTHGDGAGSDPDRDGSDERSGSWSAHGDGSDERSGSWSAHGDGSDERSGSWSANGDGDD